MGNPLELEDIRSLKIRANRLLLEEDKTYYFIQHNTSCYPESWDNDFRADIDEETALARKILRSLGITDWDLDDETN